MQHEVASEVAPQGISLAAEINQSREFAAWLRSQGHGLSTPKTMRVVAAGATFTLTIDHFDGVVTLLQAKLAGPALALIRPLFESYVQGLWLFRIATEGQIEDFLKRKSRPTLDGMLSKIDATGFFDSPMRIDMKQSVEAMHGFTHGGPRHIENRFDGNNIKANYPPDLLIEALRYANAFSFMALLEMIAMADDQSLGDRIYLEGRERLGLAGVPASIPHSESDAAQD